MGWNAKSGKRSSCSSNVEWVVWGHVMVSANVWSLSGDVSLVYFIWGWVWMSKKCILRWYESGDGVSN